jgi:hypothetical protein
MQAAKIHSDFRGAMNIMQENIDETVSIPVTIGRGKKPYSELRADIGRFTFLPNPPRPLYYPDARLFLFRRANTGWHQHSVDETLMCQVKGAKRVGLLPAQNDGYKAIKKIFLSDSYMSDKTALSQLQHKINPLIITVEQGDALYIPPFWWHGVDTLNGDYGITLVYCWRSPWHKVSNLKYPTVREIWKSNVIPPHPFILILPFIGLCTLVAHMAKVAKNIIKSLI